MCGIIGQIAQDQDVSIQKDILNVISHRGPDARGVYESPGCFLGHVRLAILDPDERSNQPFSDGAGRYHLAYNGEIYNFKKLKADLHAKGVEFQTTSDTEVLLQLLIKYGEKTLSMLNGFFAFAFWDEHKKKLLLARDRMGIKPLWYHLKDQRLSFASEMRGLLAMGIRETLNHQSISTYLQYTYISAPDSILNNVFKLKPGQMAVFEAGELTCDTWYQPEASNSNFTLEQLMQDAVQSRLISDVPIGSFLSGGLDSSLIAAMAVRSKPELLTFSISFPDYPYLDEGPHARQVANYIGSNHQNIELSSSDMLGAIDDFMSALDEPFADSSSLAVYLLSRETSKHLRVALSGDGADELFGGYRKHRALLRSMNPGTEGIMMGAISRLLGSRGSRESRLADRKRQLARYVKGLNMTLSERYWYWATFSDRLDVEAVLNKPIGLNMPEITSFEQSLVMDQKRVLPNDMLHKVDLMSMASGLEVRTPFLDHRVVEKARGYMSKDLLNKRQGKLPLRKIAEHYLPSDIIHRRKQGFEVPLNSWLKNDLSYLVKDILDSSLLQENIFNLQGVTQVANEFIAGDTRKTSLIWSLIVLQRWLENNRDHWSVS